MSRHGAGAARPFTVAILSDIHGNDAALAAVLDDLRPQPHDRIVIAGDLAMNGPRPREALARLRALGAPTIRGNADRAVCSARSTNPGARWVRERLGQDHLSYLACLPFSHRITPPSGVSPGDDLLVVHSTPASDAAILTVQPDPFGLLNVTPPERAAQLLGDATAGIIVSGHVHYASEGTAAGRRFASVGSVGFPYDGDPRAAYALATWDGRSWRLRHRRVTYDHRQVADEVRAWGYPFGERAAERLLLARFIPLA